ncbi:MAG: DUF2461 domain-containing protein [Bacteroidaceae bacterium]|nr:DUF2461 domain-containing protein [Bacteroidaceae bacterium]
MNTTNTERKKVLSFLRQLKQHNERPWFKANRALYDETADIFQRMAADFIQSLADFDEEIAGIEVKKTTYRIYRDTRFSADKSPYKTHIGSFINARGQKTPYLGYYLHVEPNASMVACGNYWLPSDTLQAIRNEIVANPKRLLDIITEPRFKQLFGETIGMDCLKTVPKGFPKDFPHPELIRPRAYCVMLPLTDSEVVSANWLQRATEACQVAKPFMDYFNETVEDYL